MSVGPFRGATRVGAPVQFTATSNRGCVPSIVIGLALGGGFVGLGYALGWIDWTWGGTVIGGGLAIAFVSSLCVLFMFYKAGPAQEGTLILEGTRMSGPDQEASIDFNEPYDLVVRADAQQAELRLTFPSSALADAAPDEVGRQLAKSVGAGWGLHLKGVSATELRDRFGLPAYVEPLDPATIRGMTLDRNDPRQHPLIDPLLDVLAHCRAQNVRYQAFAALPWQQTPSPATPLLRDIALEPGADPKTFFTALAASPAGADPANPLAVIAKAYLDVRLCLGEQVGITPDYVLIDAFGGVEQRNDHCYTLVPIGSYRCTMRRDMHRATSVTSVSVASTTYPAIVVEAPSLGEPLWVVFPKGLWGNADNEVDAAVAFVNRA
ncbi:MAG: hypothetical protein JRI23_30960 [Deltaproteobacteria bacterium]|jgi:hypothetical protein|nr:hypothetical protein [Deltaproteobacteria bacterium]MBW2536622.1 hypothetical protein [Deltaproteobacteria bacterium]